MNVQDLQKGDLHHAYLLNGVSDSFGLLEGAAEQIFETRLKGNPDILVEQLDAFTVDNARAVVSFAGRSAFIAGAHKVVLICFSTITREAQNILLKTLEEPSRDTHIFILTPNIDMLLPTVLSRCLHIELGGQENQGSLVASKNFLSATLPERLKIIEKIVKRKDKQANKAELLELLSGLEVYLEQNKDSAHWQQSVEAVLQAKRYMHGKGAMAKMLMESVALVV